MNHGISAYRNALASQIQPAARAEQTSRQREAAPPQTVRELQQSRAAATDLTAEESGMIDRYFPANEEMSLRIYGPGNKPANLNPGGIGSRLDLRG